MPFQCLLKHELGYYRVNISQDIHSTVLSSRVYCIQNGPFTSPSVLFAVHSSLLTMPELTEIERAAGVTEPVPSASAAADASGTDSDSDVSAPELEDAGAGSGINFPGGAAAAAAAGLPIDISKAKQTRGEKKARKIMSKLGLKPVSCSPLYFVIYFHTMLTFFDFSCLIIVFRLLASAE